MKVKNLKSGRIFDCSSEQFKVIQEQGNGYKYEIIEKDEPLELKSFKSLREKNKEK